eukprot:768431-Hanusia_phi.AAC.20
MRHQVVTLSCSRVRMLGICALRGSSPLDMRNLSSALHFWNACVQVTGRRVKSSSYLVIRDARCTTAVCEESVFSTPHFSTGYPWIFCRQTNS